MTNRSSLGLSDLHSLLERMNPDSAPRWLQSLPLPYWTEWLYPFISVANIQSAYYRDGFLQPLDGLHYSKKAVQTASRAKRSAGNQP